MFRFELPTIGMPSAVTPDELAGMATALCKEPAAPVDATRADGTLANAPVPVEPSDMTEPREATPAEGAIEGTDPPSEASFTEFEEEVEGATDAKEEDPLTEAAL
jgi:hypothetical protein